MSQNTDISGDGGEDGEDGEDGKDGKDGKDDENDEDGEGGYAMIDLTLLEILVCPVARCPLSYDAKKNELVSLQARKAYPVRDGVPIMLIDEARDLEDHDLPG